MSGRPDFEVMVKGRGEKYGTKVGAAWKNEHGGINIKLNTGVALIHGDHYITLWPPKEGKRSAPPKQEQAPTEDEWGDNDMPF